ncbi:class I SAM-dependent methyltransferase [Bradyrhizobium sp. ARR65]|uniref:class I SAM-dependent methyltransferase n=1 Tax=Bradyrhizobium sp. ARR65 TaxID=1040989 RepID=UPI000464698F|nr:class I SAM-dependent methyltransferase [Bradyrhizobium sp. ARR65]
MSRFATTVPLYAQFRPPYPPAFFRTVAERLGFSKQHALIDLGTGPGLLALGFAAYVGRIVGVDPEPAMIAAAREAAVRTGQAFALIEGRAEQLPHDVGTFEVVTIGRALHWMDRAAIAALFERLVAPNGVIVVCSARSAADGRNPWLDEYNAARQFWSGTDGSAHHRQDLAALLGGTRFRLAETIEVESNHEITPRDLAQRVLTFSTSSPAVLGDKAGAMLADVERRMQRFSREGVITEIVVSKAEIARET